MYNVILTDFDNTQYYVSSDGKLVTFYNKNESIKYEFEDADDAYNVRWNYLLNHWEDKEADKIFKKIEVVQM